MSIELLRSHRERCCDEVACRGLCCPQADRRSADPAGADPRLWLTLSGTTVTPIVRGPHDPAPARARLAAKPGVNNTSDLLAAVEYQGSAGSAVGSQPSRSRVSCHQLYC